MTFLPIFFDANVFFVSLTSPSDQVQNGRIFVKDIVFERTFSAQNNAIPAIAGVVKMAIIRNML